MRQFSYCSRWVYSKSAWVLCILGGRVHSTPPIQTHDGHEILIFIACSFYRNPDEDEIEDAAAKLDHAAAQRRSVIRRDPPPRPRHQSSSVGLTNIIRSRARQRAQQDDAIADRRIEILEAELDQLRRQRDRTTSDSRSERARRRFADDRSDASAFDSTDAADAAQLVELLVSDSHADARTIQAATETISLPRPARESNLRFELERVPSQASADGPRASFMPSPPHSLGDESRSRPVDGPLEPWSTTPPLTRGFAPAQAARSANESDPRDTDAIVDMGLETPPPEGWENSYPPLRRVPHMSPRPLPRRQSNDDFGGLGDRRRSPSPMSEAREEISWNNIMETVDDRELSSESTSFASTAHLAVSQPVSSNTSFGEIGSTSDDGCDLPPGISAADARRLRNEHRANHSHSVRPASTRRRRIDAPVSSSRVDADLPLSVLIDEARALRERREQRRDDETLMYRAIFERMQRHEHVPDEWWALAGLSEARLQSNEL